MNISKDTPFGLAMVLSGIVLMAFAAVVFIGLSGMFQGKLIIPILSTLVGVIAVFYCLIRICRWKQTFNEKKGLLREIPVIVLMLLIMLCGAAPISNVTNAIDNKEGLQADVDSIIEEVASIAPTYKEYVEKRTEAYKKHLNNLHTGSNDYQKQLFGAAGDSKPQKVKAVVASLKRRLINQEIEDIEAKRTVWLNGLTNFNAFTQRTASIVAGAGLKWLNEYKRISSIQYSGEEYEPFDMPELCKRLSRYGLGQTDILHPSMLGIISALGSLVVILIPYLMTRRSGKSKSGTHK